MRARSFAFRRPLDQVFSAPSHIAILRALLDTAEGMSGRQVARLARINHQACATALHRLEALEVVQRQGAGQSQLFRLNRDHILVRDLLVPLLRREREVFLGVLERLRHLAAARGVRALLFGSAARGEEGPESDLDLLLLADGVRGRQIARQVAEEARAILWKEWGLRVNPIVLSQRAVELRRKRRDPLIANILREGIDVGAGRHLERERAKTRATPAG